MFNGYNETPLISYEYNPERIEKKAENATAKWSYPPNPGVQPSSQTSERHTDFWPGKPNLGAGVSNVVKCSCAGCFASPENQSYQGENARHRPWLPRSFPVPLNGSNESCKLPAYQWDNGLSNQSLFYQENTLSYVQENGGKHANYYRPCQNSRLMEPNQPGVITSLKNADYCKKTNGELSGRGEASPIQNGTRQPMFCNPAYNLNKRPECGNPNGSANATSYSMDPHMAKLPVVEPFIKAVPSNLSQTRVPSTGYRSVKENMPQSYIDPGYGDLKKHCPEPGNNGEKRNEMFGQTGARVECSYRGLPDSEQQKFYFDNTRHTDYYARNNVQEVNKRNTQLMDPRRDCAMSQVPEEHYNRSKYLEGGGSKPCELNSGCYPDGKTDAMHSRFMFNEQRAQSSYFYQTNPPGYKNYLRPDYPYQGFNPQTRYEYPVGYQNQCRSAPQQLGTCDAYPSQFAGFPSEGNYPEKTQPFYGDKNPTFASADLSCTDKKPNYLEAIRSEEINKNGTSKISPLRLLRKKKLINVPQESVPSNKFDSVPGLDVRKFWSTWAEEEEENVAPTQMVVLDCQDIDPEQAKLLQLYETDPVQDLVIKESSGIVQQTEETDKTCEFELKDKETDGVQSKKEQSMDKWTEKKFDFLKRSEESKAAELLRHEEEKKKIFETRQNLQQNAKKAEKSPEKSLQMDENSQSDESGPASTLPTSEYRRNKFLDYSKTIEAIEADKLEIYPSDDKDNVLDDILDKMTEINFPKPEEEEEEEEESQEDRSPVRKVKKKKQEQATENEKERKDKLTVETATKPTIKFSIQKSHDLKISFKVLNSKEYSDDEEPRRNDPEQKTTEDGKNSTELITLKYKSIQRDGTETKKAKKKKKDGESRKSSKTKRNRYATEVERDPLGDESPTRGGKDAEREDFQVEETMDSAKIKLTFKRHKGNFETEYKINETPGEACESLGTTTTMTTSRGRKKSRRAKKHGKIFAESGVEPFQNCTTSDVDSGSEMSKRDEPTSFPLMSPTLDMSPDPEPEDSKIETEPFVLSTEDAEYKCEDGFEFPLTDCDTDVKKSPTEEENEKNEEEKENEEVSFDFITSPKTEEIDINHPDGDTSTDTPKFPAEPENESLEIFSPSKTEVVMEEEKVPDTINVEMETVAESVAEELNQGCEKDEDTKERLSVQAEDTDRPEEKHQQPKRVFIVSANKITRRHSTDGTRETWSRRKFSKAKSCPPDVEFPDEDIPVEDIPVKDVSVEDIPDEEVPVEDIPVEHVTVEDIPVQDIPVEDIPVEDIPVEDIPVEDIPVEDIPVEDIPVENIPLPIGPPNLDSCFHLRERRTESNYTEAKEKPKELILDRDESQLSPDEPQALEMPSPGILQRSSKIKFSFLKKNKVSKIPTGENEIEDEKLGQIQEVPTKPGADQVLPCEDLEESVEIMSDFIREELYEDIPTSEDQDDAETEKVNDDKFRNIMQNCLENAKKFLNVGNLKLFSCSVDDLLGLDFQGTERDGEEPEKETSHISRDVLLTSCEDANEDLGLSENVQVPEMTIDFLPSALESDACPEILPVNNWPYLEEEVPSSPIGSNENDLMTSFEYVPESETYKRKRVASESLAENRENKWKTPRRKTIESITETSRSRHGELLEQTGFKCKLSLEKLSRNRFRFELENNARNLNYKSPTWQPRVMLFRISKNELKNVLKPTKKANDVAEVKRQEERTKGKDAEEAFELDFIKGSFNASVGDVERKRKKSRFRNLHTKRKPETGKTVEKEKSVKDENHRRQEEVKHKHRHKHERRRSPKSEKKTRTVWMCEVCGFDDPSERVTHIKSHPFHCQSCHLAFKTESHFTEHLTRKHKDIRNQHHCLLCELSFDTEEQYLKHLETREHRHLESVEKNTINTLFTILTGGPCPVLGLADIKPEWLPNQAGTVHFYHQATPLSLALQYLKMHRDLSSYSATSSTHPS